MRSYWIQVRLISNGNVLRKGHTEIRRRFSREDGAKMDLCSHRLRNTRRHEESWQMQGRTVLESSGTGVALPTLDSGFQSPQL